MSIHMVQVQQQSLYDYNSEDIQEQILDYEYDNILDGVQQQNQHISQPFAFQMFRLPQNIVTDNIQTDSPIQDVFLQNDTRLFIDTEFVMQHLDSPDRLREMIQHRNKSINQDAVSSIDQELVKFELGLDTQLVQNRDTTTQMPIQFNTGENSSTKTHQLSIPQLTSTFNNEINKSIIREQRRESNDLKIIQLSDLHRDNINTSQISSKHHQTHTLKNENAQLNQKDFIGSNQNKYLKTESKKIFQWDKQLHLKFALASLSYGIKNVTPKQILRILDDPRLDREKVSSHLQKFRIHVAKEYNVQVNQLQNTHIPAHLDHPFTEIIKKHWESQTQVPICSDIVKQFLTQIQ